MSRSVRRRSDALPATEPGQHAPPSSAMARSQPTGVIDQAPRPLVESLRYLVGRFQLGEHSTFPRRLAVTSALHGEGVTTISRTLAAVVANDLDVPVCWIDLSAGSGHESDLDQPFGLAEVLTGDIELSAALRPTADPRLVLLPAGSASRAQRESLSRGSHLAKIVDQLAETHTIIMDTPPVLAGSAGFGQIRHANSYLLVVRHGVTSSQQVRAATDELTAIPSLGVVLNRYNTSIPKRLTHFFVS
jgi:Mrp family chromosome partitioning ATPase